MKKTFFFAFLSLGLNAFAQTTIYSESFTGQNGKGATGGDSVSIDLSAVSWTIDVSNAELTATSDWFRVESERFEGRDLDGSGATWYSPVINIAAYTNISAQLATTSQGGMEITDQCITEYQLNSGIWTEFTTDGNLNDNFNNATPSVSSLSGSSLQIRVTMTNGAGPEIHSLDNVLVEGVSSGGNAAPFISNISNTPDVPTSSDTVTVTATVSDTDGLASVALEYGFAAGVYDQTPIVMNLSTADTYTATINTQANGTAVYYQIAATDSNAMPESATSAEQSYTIMDPQAQGLQINALNTTYTIDFDTTVTNVNNGSFSGTGFAAVPTAGQLDANAFAIDGLQDATTIFGEEQSGNDFGKGISSGGTTSGGIYAFEVAANDYALGIQPTGDDFTPGTIHLQFTNNTGAIVTDVSLAYEVYFFNNETRSNDFICSHGPDTSSLTTVSASRIFSGLESDAVPVWERNVVAIELTGLSIPAGGTYVIAWTSVDEGGGSSDEIALDNIQIIANPSTQLIEASGTLESITLLGNLNLTAATDVLGSLNLFSGVLTTNDHLTLKSTAGKTAIVAPVVSGSVDGDVSVEQFYSEQRAFRFVGSTVNMTGTLFDNWQQGGLDPGDAGYEPGIGTHITGGTQANGFDFSATNALSAFTFNNTTQAWENLSPTNATALEPGKPLRLYIRGDRSVSLTTAGSLPTATTLRSKGTLANGAVALSALSTTEGGFNFMANPYQAQIDLVSLLADASTIDINPNLYYAWDPTIGTHGAYATYDFNLNTNNVAGSEVNQFLQPGQAIFIATAEDGDVAGLSPEVLIKQSFKTTSTATTDVYRSSNVNEWISISVFKDNELLSGKARDGVLISFTANASPWVTAKDAIKLQNPNENLSVLKNSESLSITERVIPSDGDLVPLQLTGLTGSDYTFELNNGFTGLQTLFVDAYLGTETRMISGINLVRVSFDGTDPTSLQAARFSLKFVNSTLSVDDSAFAKALTIHPNPMTGSSLMVSNLLLGQPVVIYVYNAIGQKISTYKNILSTGIETLKNLGDLKSAVYFLRIHQGNASTTLKFIKK